MPTPFESVYDGATTDDTITLAHGITIITTTLAVELSAVEEEVCYLVSAAGASPRAAAKIDDEIIYYESLHSIGQLLDLRRAQEGTTAVLHTVAAPVTIVSAPRFGNPAVFVAMLAMQVDLVDALARIAALEAV